MHILSFVILSLFFLVCWVYFTWWKRVFYALKNRTTRTIYWRHMGHSLSTLPQFVHVAMWPHSNKTHSIAASMQILHKSTVGNLSTATPKRNGTNIICNWMETFSRMIGIEIYLDNFVDRPIAVERVQVIRSFHSILWNRLDWASEPPWVA